MSKLYDIEFDKAYCLDFKETFNSTDSSPMKIDFTIVARTLKFNSKSVYEKNWKI